MKIYWEFLENINDVKKVKRGVHSGYFRNLVELTSRLDTLKSILFGSYSIEPTKMLFIIIAKQPFCPVFTLPKTLVSSSAQKPQLRLPLFTKNWEIERWEAIARQRKVPIKRERGRSFWLLHPSLNPSPAKNSANAPLNLFAEVVFTCINYWMFISLSGLFFFILFVLWVFWISAAEHKCLKRGVKEVVKSIRRGNKGYVGFHILFMNLFIHTLVSLVFNKLLLGC